MKETFKAATCIGRQPNSDVSVFRPDLKINSEGGITNSEESSFLWVQEAFNMFENSAKTRNQTWPMSAVRLPLYGYALRDVINSLIHVVHDQFWPLTITCMQLCFQEMLFLSAFYDFRYDRNSYSWPTQHCGRPSQWGAPLLVTKPNSGSWSQILPPHTWLVLLNVSPLK